jgi:multiple sugar transport system permease protein
MTSVITPPAAAAGSTAPRGGGRPGDKKRRSRQALVRSLPLLPAVLLLALFLFGPVVSSLYGSLTNTSLTGSTAANSDFVGVQNYVELFADPDFPKSVLLTIIFLVASAIIGQNGIGLTLAVLMQSANRVVRGAVSTIVVTAWVLPEIVAAFAAYAFFHDGGTLNEILGVFGVQGPNWLYSFPMFAVILANVWRGTAFSMLVYTAALNDVPPEITEAAEVDGASGWKRFAYITVPMIRRSISTNLMLTTLQTLSVFALIFVMTGGGPGTDSTTLPLLAYQEAFKFGELGFGTAIATILLLVGALFSVFYIRALKPEVD